MRHSQPNAHRAYSKQLLVDFAQCFQIKIDLSMQTSIKALTAQKLLGCTQNDGVALDGTKSKRNS